MANRFDIQFEIHLEGRQGLVDSRAMLQVLDVIETATFSSDRDDVTEAAQRLQLTDLVRDACLERLRKYRHKRLLLRETGPGSLAVFGLLAGVSYFVIHKTIGESFTEAFKTSEAHERLKALFRSLIDHKALRLVENVRRVLASRKTLARVQMTRESGDDPHTIVIYVGPQLQVRDSDAPRPLGAELD
jgi:hypothetical protein